MSTDSVDSEGHASLESAAEAWLELRAGNSVTSDLAFVRDRFGERCGEIVEVQP